MVGIVETYYSSSLFQNSVTPVLSMRVLRLIYFWYRVTSTFFFCLNCFEWVKCIHLMSLECLQSTFCFAFVVVVVCLSDFFFFFFKFLSYLVCDKIKSINSSSLSRKKDMMGVISFPPLVSNYGVKISQWE